ncbi:hypothetical protein [Chitinibacter sp. GC72]|uniref:hypothetical protein n=1 Tax=Chitinibacter sp. GC72 TaxID=1526917 RepID=UPI0012F8225A|nr:hypothetical protein [Chitinibacter sp. GC72]
MDSPAAAPSEERAGRGFGCACFGKRNRRLDPSAVEGISAADADAGGCFGVKGYLQKQIPLPVSGAETNGNPLAGNAHKNTVPKALKIITIVEIKRLAAIGQKRTLAH